LTDDDLRRFFHHLEHELHYSLSTVGITHAALKFFFEHTCPRDMPFLRLFRTRKEKKIPTVLSRSEVRNVLHRVRDVRYRACLTLIYTCGLRISEGINIEIGDIDGQQGLVYIRNGKGGKSRAVPVSDLTLQILRDMWKIHRHPRLLFPSSYSPGKPKSQSGCTGNHPITRNTLRASFRNALAASGCRKKATPHSLRHSFATHLLEEGVPVFTVKEYLGHSCLSSTMKYTHLTRKIRRDGTGAIERLATGLL
jgi:site-specific recombinase XerD